VPSNDHATAEQVHEAFTALMRWAQRGDVRRLLIGDAAVTLSINDITLLRAIDKHGPVRVSDLAAWQGVDKSTVTPQVHRLEDRGLVARQGDPHDRRAVRLSVTGLGRRTLQGMNEVGVHLFEQALDGWPRADQRALATLMLRLAAELAVVPHQSTLPAQQHI
jgi:DNA-binding MarR family transcriptional regulator